MDNRSCKDKAMKQDKRRESPRTFHNSIGEFCEAHKRPSPSFETKTLSNVRSGETDGRQATQGDPKST